MYELIKNVMNIYELSHEYVYICMFLFDFCLFLSCALCWCITMMDVSDDYAGWIVSDWMFKHELFIEGRWILKMQVKCMFQFNTSGSRIKIHTGITDM